MFLVAVIILFAVLTVLRNEQWRDPLVFWTDALAKSPDKKRIHGYIGNVYRDRGDMPAALKEYRLMLANDFRYGQDHFGLGEELLQNGFYREAVEEYLVALKIRPDKTFIYQRLAEAYGLLGDEQRAGEARAKALAGDNAAGNEPGVW
jgi:predicted Zn-dependent protease